MEKIKAAANSILKTMVNTMIDIDASEWPPSCAFFAYQPIRPKQDCALFEERKEILRESTDK